MADVREVYFAAADGLELFARDYGDDGLTPVMCLPGLTRNSRDFETVAPRLSPKRRVICPDYRGRGRSQYAADPVTYRPDVELDDALRLLDTLGVTRAAVIGTSRGGIVAMVMAAKAKDRLAGVLFNDVGPHLETAGLLRIRNYLGATLPFHTWDGAVEALKAANPGFDKLTDTDWMNFARRVFRDDNGRPGLDYDPDLAKTFPGAEAIAAGKLADIWNLFDLVAPLPSLVLRGENSDLLSEATVAEMQRRSPRLAAVTVKGRAHVPFLDEAESIAAMDQWLARVDEHEMKR